ncbi:putative retrotransposable element [Nephila pilipes]|uniref:Putative retrotransposable element n=1 Tax=Nephila pilipes TaxID=299642 RepID=A0A8X6TG17_NEPPI|nr:putative retrotransposable element [Nephila pilipes]
MLIASNNDEEHASNLRQVFERLKEAGLIFNTEKCRYALPESGTVASAVHNGWISRFGKPSAVITDQGSQFESNLITELAHLLGIKRKRTMAYNPVCNGFVERWHAINCHANMPNTQWTQVLLMVLPGLCSIYREEFKGTPAECVYGGKNLTSWRLFLYIRKF